MHVAPFGSPIFRHSAPTCASGTASFLKAGAVLGGQGGGAEAEIQRRGKPPTKGSHKFCQIVSLGRPSIHALTASFGECVVVGGYNLFWLQ